MGWAEGWGFSQILGFGGWIDPVTGKAWSWKDLGLDLGCCLWPGERGQGISPCALSFLTCNITLIKSTSQH